MAAKRNQIMEQMRQDRNVAPAPVKSEAKDPANDKSVNGGSASNPSDQSSRTNGSVDGGSGSSVQQEWVKREQAIAAAEKRIQEATSASEKRLAQAAKNEAEAKKAIQELADAKNEPMEFLAKVGMTKAEWEHFVSQGGKMSPEARKLKAMEERISALDKRHEELTRKAEASEQKARMDLENSQFTSKMSEYTFISKIGGLQAVRNKQAQIQNGEGRAVSLTEAASVVEKEIADSLGPLLKHPDVRAKLGLDNRDQPAPSEKPQTKTLNGSEAAKSPPPTSEDQPGPLDWAAKKRVIHKLLAANNKRRETR